MSFLCALDLVSFTPIQRVFIEYKMWFSTIESMIYDILPVTNVSSCVEMQTLFIILKLVKRTVESEISN